MGKRSYRWRFFDKTKPPPKWLFAKVPDDYTTAEERHRISYYQRIWYATPPWANGDAIKAIYKEAHERRLRGEDVEVDHIYPLRGAFVCGLHCEDNLQIISRKLNSYLSNTRYPNAPQLELPLARNNKEQT